MFIYALSPFQFHYICNSFQDSSVSMRDKQVKEFKEREA